MAEWMTAFGTLFGPFESHVLPFGLCGMPSRFQAYINDQIREYLDVFMDDILIYRSSLKKHKEHVKLVLRSLGDAGLQIDIT